MAWQLWLLCALSAIGLSVTPGPNSLLVLTHGALHGVRRTGATVAGGALGFLALIALSMLGIGALLQASSQALVLLKWGGGAYLVWLGIQIWRAPPLALQGSARVSDGRPQQLFRQGLFTALSNPKALLFYGAFLPQFVDGQRPLLMQFVVMAATFVLVEIGVEFALAALAHQVRPWLQRQGQRFNRVCGALFMLMGVALPASG